MVGLKFNRLTVVARNGHKRKEAAWRCRCDCGAEVTLAGNAIRSGAIKSCGCAKSDFAGMFKPRHGLADTRVHRSWMSMLDRCNRATSSAYHNYGGRGITVCERWQVFENFLADMGPMPEGYTLDRIDVNGNYEPANCRWATYSEQARNTRRSQVLTINGETKCKAEWARISGTDHSTINLRLKRGLTPEQAVFGRKYART